MRTWKPTDAEQRALKAAEAALLGYAPGKAPTVTWYSEYGCALLAWTPRVDQVHLELIGLDRWAFHMHSGPRSRTFGARADLDAPVVLHVAHVRLQHFSILKSLAKFLMAAKNPAHKKTPAMILTILRDAVDGLSAIEAGTIEAAHLRLRRFGKFKSLAEKFDMVAKEHKRSAAANQQGNQKTPEMIIAILTDAIEALRGNEGPDEGHTAPRGGFTDATQRDTAWPLLRSVLQVAIEAEANHELYRKTMAQLLLHLAESGVASLKSDSTTFTHHANAIMQLLRNAASEGAELADDGINLDAFGARCVLVRHKLDKLVATRVAMSAERHKLDKLSKIECTNPKLILPDETTPASDEAGLENSRKRAESELKWLPVLSGECNAASKVLDWLKHKRLKPTADGHVAAQLVMSEVERYFFTKACSALQLSSSDTSESCKNWESLVEQYRLAMSSFKQSQGSVALLAMELLSRELLVVWIAACLSHKLTKQTEPLLADYAIPLNPDDLHHLVLSEELSIDAARNVTSYLRASRPAGAACVFSLLTEDKTFVFAHRCANGANGDEIRQKWETESKEAARREEARWEEIERRKKKLVEKLDPELRTLKTDLESQQSIRERNRSIYGVTLTYADEVIRKKTEKEAIEKINELKPKIDKVDQDIKATEIAPPPIMQPLPRDINLALPILFWLNMSSDFRVVSRMCFMAQQMLLPKDAMVTLTSVDEAGGSVVDIENGIKVDAPKFKWFDYYLRDSTKRDARSYSAVETKVILGSAGEAPKVILGSAGEVLSGPGQRNVRDCNTSSDGVWHPDSLVPVMYWTGGSFPPDTRGNYFDPFRRLQPAVLVQKFTVQLSGDDRTMQWALDGEYSDSARKLTRGNMPEAVQDKMAQDKMRKPEAAWLMRKPAFLAFGALRAYPKQQIRCILTALHDHSLPLDQPLVRLLLLQTLYHLGEFSKDDAPKQVWRTDLEEYGGWEALCVELKSLVEELRFKQREHSAVLALGEIAAHAAQWHTPCREVARDFAKVARAWGDDLDKDIKKMSLSSSSPEHVAGLRAKRCLYCMYGIVCHTAGELSDEDAASLCELIVLADYCRLFDDALDKSLKEQVRSLTAVTNGIMARRLPTLLVKVDSDKKSLTDALRLVLPEATPNSLEWKHFTAADGARTCCYEAVHDKDLFSVNLLTGTILFNGRPPSRLPKEILDEKLYQRTFDQLNFEVVSDADGVLTTTRAIAGRVYSFFLDSKKRLVVRERDDEDVNRTVLELLDGTAEEAAKWGGSLPIRLRHMHSHWLCITPAVASADPSKVIATFSRRFSSFFKRSWKSGIVSLQEYVVLLRPLRFNQRSVQFLCQNSALCYRVPDHLQQTPWRELSEKAEATFDRLVLVDKTELVIRILKKFEPDDRLIHTFVKTSDELLFELPRYDLCFELSSDNQQPRSKNFIGFSLSKTQQLKTLHGFEQYLVLESESGKQKILIVPRGDVVRTGERVSIGGSNACDAERKYNRYDVHERFNGLEPPAGRHSVLARLQLAALSAATGTAVPEAGSQQTGEELAIELVRQCWVNHPLDDEEIKQLQSVASFGQLVPALPLVCHELDMSAREMSFLHPEKRLSAKDYKLPPLEFNSDAATEYTQRKQAMQLNAHELLSPDEETRELAHLVRPRSLKSPERNLDVPPPTSAKEPSEVIRETEETLQAMLKDSTGSRPEPFPLDVADFESTQLGEHMLTELRDSWEEHQKRPSIQFVAKHTIRGVLKEKLTKISEHREEVEQYLLRVVSYIPEQCPARFNFNMRRAANLAPHVTLRDLARAALNSAELLRFNPFLSVSAEKQLHEWVLDWLKYCVLEDQLERMSKLAKEDNTQELEREFKEIGREWEVQVYPEWLVFEVEQKLKIRRVQYMTAKHLIDSPGAITQLNMGEGKTRVILPMLLLHLARPGTLVRMHFLSQLLGEAYLFLHRHLTASLMNRRLCLLPFDREKKLTNIHDVQRMYEGLLRCERNGGAVLVAPEHRLSLQLKAHDLRLSEKSSGAYVANFGQIRAEQIRAELDRLHRRPYYDIFDESDEELRHQFQLIYACGSCTDLPAGPERWIVAEALLREIRCNPEAARILTADVSKRQPPQSIFAGKFDGKFDGIRLLLGEPLERVLEELKRILAKGVLDDPPYEMLWIRPQGKKHQMHDGIIEFVTDPGADLASFRKRWKDDMGEEIKSVQCDHLLALRGMLACGLLVHCLSRRHRVDYGIDERRGITRRTAVPYRGSNTPSDRAEYAQPDILILLSLLSYYHDGLTREQIEEATRTLLKLGPQAQKDQYALWLSSASQMMNEEQEKALNSVEKLDLTNELQFDMLFTVYRYNMAAVNFWLNSCVLPRETMQFPSRLVSNAFNLTDNPSGKVIGFSGTKDNNLLLPLHVQHLKSPYKETEATDGKMLELVLRAEVRCQSSESVSTSLADDVLKLAVNGSSALIDAGAAMAGLTNSEVAECILRLLPEDSNLSGVVFFEITQDGWYVLERSGSKAPLGSSPIHEKDAFVFFDESRCRGADMKLKPSAQATLTIGPGMCKNKLMQAAGRMRKLAFGQKLVLFVPAELDKKIRSANEKNLGADMALRSEHVLNWVVHNTVNTIADGLPEWASNGSHFCTTQNPKARLVDENLKLEGLYGGAIAKCTMYEHVKRGQAKDRERVKQLRLEPEGILEEMLAVLEDRAKTFGSDQEITSSAFDEECERELENEREREREVERQYPRCVPQASSGWDFNKLLKSTHPNELKMLGIGIMPLHEAMKKSFDPQLSQIEWKHSGIYVTHNFFETVTGDLGLKLDDQYGYFMRPLQWIITFQSDSKCCLLLSEWEAEKVLEILWARPESTVRLVQMCYLREAADTKYGKAVRLALPDGDGCARHELTMVGLQLLAGETMFGPSGTTMFVQSGTEIAKALSKLLPTPEAKKAALLLPEFRGLHHKISRSDLERFCNLDVGEAQPLPPPGWAAARAAFAPAPPTLVRGASRLR